MKNIILLIGMPGCGKTTIGKEVAEKINYKFLDMDSYIEEISKSTVKELFDKGEDYFRDSVSTSFIISSIGLSINIIIPFSLK